MRPPALGRLGQLARDLESLRFSARQRGGRLAQAEVAQADLLQMPEGLSQPRLVPEPHDGLVHRELEHIRDGMSADLDLEHFSLEPGPAAHFAGHEDVRQEDHLHLHRAGTLTFLAASTRHVEGEGCRRVATHAGLGLGREQLPDLIERPDVGDRVGARGAADG